MFIVFDYYLTIGIYKGYMCMYLYIVLHSKIIIAVITTFGVKLSKVQVVISSKHIQIENRKP